MAERNRAGARPGSRARRCRALRDEVDAFVEAQRARSRDPLAVEAGARHFALTLGRSLELALLVRQAQHDLDAHGDGRARAAALRFARERFELLVTGSRQDAAALAMDEALH